MRTFPPIVCCSTFGSEFRRRYSEAAHHLPGYKQGNRFASDEIVPPRGAKSAMIERKSNEMALLLRIEWETQKQKQF